MIVFDSIESVTNDFRGAFVTVGNFDGVHLSHQCICRKLAAEAKEAAAKSLVITFEPHPKMILHPNIRPFYLITTLPEKLKLLEKCLIDATVVVPFTWNIRVLPQSSLFGETWCRSWRSKGYRRARLYLWPRQKRYQRLSDGERAQVWFCRGENRCL